MEQKIILILSVIAFLIYMLYNNCNSNNEKFCGTCQGMDTKVCTNKKLLKDLYNKGELTEFTDLTKNEI